MRGINMKRLFTAILLCISIAAVAQGNWKLVYYKGNLQKAAGKGSYYPLTVIGTALAANEVVKLDDKTEAIFANEKKQVVQLKQKGTFAVKNFAAYLVPEGDHNFAAYYLKYVAGEITHHAAPVEHDYKNNMRNLGGVSRGNYANCLNAPFNGTLIKNTNVVFSWKPSGPPNYVFTIYSDSTLTTEVYSQAVKDTLVEINFNTAGLHGNTTYWWTVGGRGILPCNIFTFKVLGIEEVVKFENEVQQLQNGLSLSPGMAKAVEAKYWEDKCLLDDAYRAYIKACELEPGNTTFTQLKAAFETKMAY